MEVWLYDSIAYHRADYIANKYSLIDISSTKLDYYFRRALLPSERYVKYFIVKMFSLEVLGGELKTFIPFESECAPVRSEHTRTSRWIRATRSPFNWHPSSWSALEHCADGHKITNLTDASGLFMDRLCSAVMFILLSNFIVFSSLFLSLQRSLFSPLSPLLTHLSCITFTDLVSVRHWFFIFPHSLATFGDNTCR